jgi:protocatechuate 3,4-dioxygenase beta subunit
MTDPHRRRLLSLAGFAPIAVAGLAAPRSAAAATLSADRLTLTPQATQGPYWFDPKLFRADITEGKPGVPVRVALTVLGQDGAPLKGARVDIWHCDASGVYSGYEGQGDDHQTATKGQTWLRGAQLTDAAGVAAFKTLWPGWYEGRTPHIHAKVFLDARTALTCQLFVPDALSEYLYENVPAYKRPRKRDTLNSNDGIALQGGQAMVASIKETPTGYDVALTVAVDPAADWKDQGFGPGGPGGPPPGKGPPPGGRPPGGFNGPPPEGMGGPRREALTGEARLKAMVPGI